MGGQPARDGGGRGRGQLRLHALSPLGDLAGAGRAFRRVFGRQVGDQRGNRRRHLWGQRRQRPLLVRQCHRQGLAVERERPGQALIGHDA
jgi:hypothetical protein